MLVGVGPTGAAATLVFGAPLEWLFGHVTRLTLSEWLSYDHPLIRRLSLNAPGTFQHSANVALLADAAARAIGADALLSRVGGLYHDVGKANAPEDFIENQHGTNPHDALSPEASAAIFRAHVLDGVAMVVEHGMGERIAAFVREHHGTGVMRSLLNKPSSADGPAAEQALAYPGPTPRSRETAILMIADQLEATARAVAPVDEAGCLALVDRTISRIDEEGQLANAGLRLQDRELIRQVYARVLAAMHHRRMTYPPATIAPPKGKLDLAAFTRNRRIS